MQNQTQQANWDDVRCLYYDIAYKYCIFYPQFQVDELVNEAWSMTYPFINDTEYNLPAKIYRVMSRYIKSQLYRKYREKGILKNITINSINLETEKDSPMTEFLFSDSDIDNTVEDIETIDMCIKGLTFDERILLYLRFCLELTLDKIGRLLNITKEAVWAKLRDIFNKMKCNYNRKKEFEKIRGIMNNLRVV